MRNGVHGTGIGYRRDLAHALLAAPESVEFVEVVAEGCRDAVSCREVAALAELWPVVPHGVKLSLGSAEGLDRGRARELGKLARELQAPLVSEHVSFVRSGGREIGHLTELPMTREAVRVVAGNVEALRRVLPDVPLLLENIARAFVWNDRDHEMEERPFHSAVGEATECDRLLDVGSLHANAVNSGRDPFAVLASHPLERVAMRHVAGGVLEHGFYFDTHAHPVPEAVLVERVLTARDVPVLLERDAGYEAHAAIVAETQRLRARYPNSRSAARDGALLRARFENGPSGPRPRTLPYVARELLEGDAAPWTVQGFGPGAPVRVIERGARR